MSYLEGTVPETQWTLILHVVDFSFLSGGIKYVSILM